MEDNHQSRPAQHRGDVEEATNGMACCKGTVRNRIGKPISDCPGPPARRWVVYCDGRVLWHSSDGLDGTVPGAEKAQKAQISRAELSLSVTWQAMTVPRRRPTSLIARCRLSRCRHASASTATDGCFGTVPGAEKAQKAQIRAAEVSLSVVGCHLGGFLGGTRYGNYIPKFTCGM